MGKRNRFAGVAERTATPAPALAIDAPMELGDDPQVEEASADFAAPAEVSSSLEDAEPEPPPAPAAPPPVLWSVQAVNEMGFRRAGYHFAHGRPTLIDPSELSPEQRAALERDRDNHLVVIRDAT